MQLRAGADQVIQSTSGVTAVDSTKPGSIVRIYQPQGGLKKRVSIPFQVMNRGTSPLAFGSENVTAALLDGTPVAIITHDRLLREEKRRWAWAGGVPGRTAAGSSRWAKAKEDRAAIAADDGATRGGRPSEGEAMADAIQGIGDAVHNHELSQYAQEVGSEQNQAGFRRAMAEEESAQVGPLEAYMRTTVDSKKVFYGRVMLELPKSVHKGKGDVPITLVVSANGEVHRFDALLKRR